MQYQIQVKLENNCHKLQFSVVKYVTYIKLHKNHKNQETENCTFEYVKKTRFFYSRVWISQSYWHLLILTLSIRVIHLLSCACLYHRAWSREGTRRHWFVVVCSLFVCVCSWRAILTVQLVIWCNNDVNVAVWCRAVPGFSSAEIRPFSRLTGLPDLKKKCCVIRQSTSVDICEVHFKTY